MDIENRQWSMDEQHAMRSFVQRAEVRLSTMHRIAGLFVSGAGLLVLFPAFLNETVTNVVSNLLKAPYRLMVPSLAWAGLSLSLPIWALYLLIHDLVQFYFTAEHPGVKERWFYPRFVLSGIGFPPDESLTVKKAVLKRQEESSYQHFVLPYVQSQLEQYREILTETEDSIIPEGLRRETATISSSKESKLFHAAFGMTGTLDRPLDQEVASLETSLVRHSNLLRRLVLRYVKAILMFIWTFLVTIVVASLVKSQTGNPSNGHLLFAAVFYVLWAGTTPRLVASPIRWIYNFGDRNLDKMFLVTKDPALYKFEFSTRTLCYSSLLGVVPVLWWLRTDWHAIF